MQKKYRIGVDLGGTNIQVGIVDDKEKMLGKKCTKTKVERPWQEVAADMANTALLLLEELNIKLEECENLGIGSPGMIDHKTGSIVFSGNFPGWENVPLVAEVQKHINLPVRISNDANCAALGEVRAGAARGSKNIVLLTLGTGVGGGVVVDGVVQEGGAPGAMELGHTTIVVDGAKCGCGHHGCIEAYASATGLIRMARAAAVSEPASLLNVMCEGDLANMNGIIPFKAARGGDAAAQQVIDAYIKHLGEGIINCINIWRPEKILLGGGISHEGDPLLVPLNEYIRTRCFAGQRAFVPPIVKAELGNDAGIYGAAAI